MSSMERLAAKVNNKVEERFAKIGARVAAKPRLVIILCIVLSIFSSGIKKVSCQFYINFDPSC